MRIHVIMCEKGRDFMKREGRFIGRPDLIDPPDFKPAYEWLADRMEERIGPPPDGVPRWPVWAWRRWQKRPKPRMDDKAFRHLRDHVLVSLEVPDETVVLSDFNSWHAPLNDWYLADERARDRGMAEDEAFEADLTAAGIRMCDRPYPEPFRSRVRDSWQRIFHVAGSDYIQATAWFFDEKHVVDENWFEYR